MAAYLLVSKRGLLSSLTLKTTCYPGHSAILTRVSSQRLKKASDSKLYFKECPSSFYLCQIELSNKH